MYKFLWYIHYEKSVKRTTGTRAASKKPLACGKAARRESDAAPRRTPMAL